MYLISFLIFKKFEFFIFFKYFTSLINNNQNIGYMSTIWLLYGYYELYKLSNFILKITEYKITRFELSFGFYFWGRSDES